MSWSHNWPFFVNYEGRREVWTDPDYKPLPLTFFFLQDSAHAQERTELGRYVHVLAGGSLEKHSSDPDIAG